MNNWKLAEDELKEGCRKKFRNGNTCGNGVYCSVCYLSIFNFRQLKELHLETLNKIKDELMEDIMMPNLGEGDTPSQRLRDDYNKMMYDKIEKIFSKYSEDAQ